MNNFLQKNFGRKSVTSSVTSLVSRLKGNESRLHWPVKFSYLGLLTVALIGCGNNSSVSTGVVPSNNKTEPQPKPSVLATTAVLCELTQQVAADTVAVNCLLPAGADPHTYRATPQDAKAITGAQVIFYNGYNYEVALTKIVASAPTTITKIAVAEQAVPKPLMIRHDDHDHDDHDHTGKSIDPKDKSVDQAKEHESEMAPDPHVWQDISQTQRMTQVIETTLADKFPQHKAVYATNGQKYRDRLGKLDTWIRQQTATIPPNQRKLITTHHAFGYYAKAYGLTIEAALLGVSTEEQATPARLQELVQTIQQAGVPTIFAEASVNPKLMNAVAKEAKVNLATNSLFPEGTGNTESTRSYVAAMVANTSTIVTGLGGKIVPFQE